MIIELFSIKKVYQMNSIEITAIDDISLLIEEGSFVAIMGASGSGKSTLLYVIGCLTRPTSGSYRLEETDVSKLSDLELSKIRSRKIGFIFQSFNLLPRMSLQENVEVPLIYSRCLSNERRKRVNSALSMVGLANRADHHPNQLSGGEQQRGAIARALVNNPSIILADEPTGNLDSSAAKEVMETLSRLNQDGRTILMATHNEENSRFASRIIRLKDGKTVGV
ncbi:MAG: ABC transporter ATP-binding protein [bacterium]